MPRKQTPAQARKAAVDSDYTPLYAVAGLTDALAEVLRSALADTQERGRKRIDEIQGRAPELSRQAKGSADELRTFVITLPDQMRNLPESTRLGSPSCRSRPTNCWFTRTPPTVNWPAGASASSTWPSAALGTCPARRRSGPKVCSPMWSSASIRPSKRFRKASPSPQDGHRPERDRVADPANGGQGDGEPRREQGSREEGSREEGSREEGRRGDSAGEKGRQEGSGQEGRRSQLRPRLPSTDGIRGVDRRSGPWFPVCRRQTGSPFDRLKARFDRLRT